MSKTACCQCESNGRTSNIYGHVFCERCASKLGLHSDKTVLKNAEKYRGDHTSYEEEVVHRIDAMEKRFITAKIKLLHILERLTELT